MNETAYAVMVWIIAIPRAHFILPVSLFIVAKADMHGIYSNEKTIKEQAETGVNTSEIMVVRAAVLSVE